jgi:hypothetical protein
MATGEAPTLAAHNEMRSREPVALSRNPVNTCRQVRAGVELTVGAVGTAVPDLRPTGTSKSPFAVGVKLGLVMVEPVPLAFAAAMLVGAESAISVAPAR